MASKSKQSESPVAARERLEQDNPTSPVEATERQQEIERERLEEQAKEQEKTQKEELNSSAPGGREQKNVDKAPAAARAGARGAATQGGFVDQMSRRSANDALEGHYVVLDLNDDGVKEAYEAANIKDHRGDYGVYIEPASVDPDTGIPESIVVQLRDETHARIVVPYEAARPVAGRGRG